MTPLETKRIKALRDEIEHWGNALKTAKDSSRTLCEQFLEEDRARLEDALDKAPYLQERNTLPKSLATDLLTATHCSGTNRRKASRARENHYVSPQTRIPAVYKQAARFTKADITQVVKWLRRAQLLLKRTKRDTTRKAFLKQEAPWQSLQKQIIERRIEALEQVIDQLKLELNNRHGK